MNSTARFGAVIALLTALTTTSAHAQTSTVASQLSAGLRLACFSPQRAFSESQDGKAAIARLAAVQREKARAVDEKRKALQAGERAIQQGALSDDARAQRSTEVEKFKVDVQRFIEDAQAELMGIQREAEHAFLVKLRPAIEKVARDKRLQVVLNVDDDRIAWFDPSLDITSEIVQQLAAR